MSLDPTRNRDPGRRFGIFTGVLKELMRQGGAARASLDEWTPRFVAKPTLPRRWWKECPTDRSSWASRTLSAGARRESRSAAWKPEVEDTHPEPLYSPAVRGHIPRDRGRIVRC